MSRRRPRSARLRARRSAGSWRVEAGLRERAHGLGSAEEGAEAHRARPRGAWGAAVRAPRRRVITPSAPSEPSSIRSGLGPAPDPGSRRDSHSPAGVIARTLSTRSSTCVSRVAKCPPARVATQPPSVDSSKDCGKKRIVRPCAPSSCSTRGPAAPAPISAARETVVELVQRVERAEVERTPRRRSVRGCAPRLRRRRSCRRRRGSRRR